MRRNNREARQQICNYITAKYNKIEVQPGNGLFNYQCHRTAVDIAVKKGDKKIAMVVYIEDGYPIVHFVNFRKKQFIDNTLGEWTTKYDYYFIKWINKDELFEVFTIFDAFKEELGKKLSWWTRINSNYRG